MESSSYQLWFAVRFVHIISVSLLAGGAMMVCMSGLFRQALPERRLTCCAVASAYEWAFWSLAGVTAATGISNLGLKGDGLLGPETTWGTALLVKLIAVLLLMALSLVRTDFMIRYRGMTSGSVRTHTTLMTLYGLTVVALLGTIWIGLGLAHGRY